MNIPLNAEQYIKLVTESAFIDREVRLEFYNDGSIVLGDMLNFVHLDVDLEYYQTLIDQINGLTIADMILVDQNSAEVGIRRSFSNSYLRYADNSLLLSDLLSEKKFTLAHTTELYLIYLLYKCSHENEFFAFFRAIGKSFIRDAERRSFKEFLSIFEEEIRTARLEISDFRGNITEIKKQFDAHLYLQSKRFSAMLSRVNNVNQFHPGRQYGDERLHSLNMWSPPDDLAPPVGTPEEILYIYQTAFSSTSPEHQFFNFYRIIEHQLFTSTYEKALKEASQIILAGDFDANKIDHMDRLLRTSLKNLFREDGDFRVKESISLTDLIRRYDVVEGLAKRLSDYDPDLIQYFSDNGVVFCTAPKFNLSETPNSGLSKKIADRLYAVRNAIFHNKILSNNRYNPMKHEASLRPEVILVRAIAELIIEEYRVSF